MPAGATEQSREGRRDWGGRVLFSSLYWILLHWVYDPIQINLVLLWQWTLMCTHKPPISTLAHHQCTQFPPRTQQGTIAQVRATKLVSPPTQYLYFDKSYFPLALSLHLCLLAGPWWEGVSLCDSQGLRVGCLLGRCVSWETKDPFTLKLAQACHSERK